MDNLPLILKAVWTIFTCASLLNGSGGVRDKGDETRLLSDLFKGYNTNVRPVNNGSDAINVDLKANYKQLQNVDEPLQKVTSLVWFVMKWQDAFLQWNPRDYGGNSIIFVDPSQIWKPDLTLYNNAHENGGDLYSFKTKIAISSNGSARWLAPAILQSVCTIDIAKFPFDEQECVLKIGSWTHNSRTLHLSLYDNKHELDTDGYEESTEWTLVSATAKKNNVMYTCCPRPFQDITFKFRFRRKPLYYIMTMMFPCIILSLLASVSFLFPAESGERVSLIINVILSLVVLMIIVNDKTPVNSNSVPMITLYFSIVAFMTLLTLVVTAFILRMNHSSSSNPVPPSLASIRDRLAFVLCVKKNRDKPRRLNVGDALTAIGADFDKWLKQPRDLVVPMKEASTQENILAELRKVSRRLEDDKLTDERKDEWRYTVRVFDKLFFFVFFIVYSALPIYIVSSV